MELGVWEFFEHPGGLPTRAWRRCWKELTDRNEKGIRTKRWMERRSKIIGRGGYGWWEKGGEWLHFEPVVQLLYRRESLENLDSPVRDECGWQHSVTACLFLLPFWHKNRSPLTVPVYLLVWVFRRLQSESGLIIPKKFYWDLFWFFWLFLIASLFHIENSRPPHQVNRSGKNLCFLTKILQYFTVNFWIWGKKSRKRNTKKTFNCI